MGAGIAMAVKQHVQRADIPAICKSCHARRGGLCGALKPSQLAQLAEASSRHEVLAGTELSDGEICSNLLSGVVKLTRILADGRQQIVGFHFAPDFVGRPFEPKRPIKAKTLTKVTLCSFPRSIIERMTYDSPELGRKLLRHTLNELDDARHWMTALGRKTASEKVSSFLLMIARNIEPANHSASSPIFNLPLTRTDIADFLGLTVETVSRELTRLRSDGVIKIANKRHISLESVLQLEERCSD